MESIEKLRTVARNMAKGMNLENHEECNLLLIIANEIEREIAEEHRRAIAELQAENDELRELISDTLMDVRDYCAKYGIDIDDPWGNANADLDRRMRELGIEVEP